MGYTLMQAAWLAQNMQMVEGMASEAVAEPLMKTKQGTERSPSLVKASYHCGTKSGLHFLKLSQ